MGFDEDDLELKMKFDKLAGEFNFQVNEIDRFLSFLLVDEKEKCIFKEAMKILNKKNKNIKNCRSLKDAKEHVRLKKIRDDYLSDKLR